jgi:hypothetical protein
MVEKLKIDRLTNLMLNKAGMTEAVILPYLEIIEIIRLHAVSKKWN